jgi:hypothetical protein
MSRSQSHEIAPQLFECLLERAAADLFARSFEKHEINEMSGSQSQEKAPQLFECFIDRAEADLPEFFHEWAKVILTHTSHGVGKGALMVAVFDASRKKSMGN